MSFKNIKIYSASALAILLGHTSTASGVNFTNFSDQAIASYERVPSLRAQGFNHLKNNPQGPYTLEDNVFTPLKPRGAPGVCLLDFDKDGDLDIYATNGPGENNTLLSNQLIETGIFGFIEISTTAGVSATEQDSSGCVFGDIDNDGDHDLYVLGSGQDNILYENNGDGTFSNITERSGTSGDAHWASSASMGDINNDGLIDIYVGNTSEMNTRLSIFAVPTDLNEHNQLFLNIGDNTFKDISTISGIEDLKDMRIVVNGAPIPIPGSPAGISWAVAMVDIDLDGDIDLFQADDQAAIASVDEPASPINADRGFIHLFENNGSGEFVDSYRSPVGSWMGLAFGDFNHDGNMDYFGSNFGDLNIAFSRTFAIPGFEAESALGIQPSRWFFGNGDNTFIDSRDLGTPAPSIPGLVTTPFGWGVSAFDYDNDSDTDIAFVGGLQDFFMVMDNPLAILNNDGNGNFSRDSTALSPDSNLRHALAIEQGMATGDLNHDGFIDIVSVAAFQADTPVSDEFATFTNPFNELFGGAYDADARTHFVFEPVNNSPAELTFNPGFLTLPNGKLFVEMNSADNGNNWVSVSPVGTVGLLPKGSVNRDGIGAVIQFTPNKSDTTAMQPILGGASYASQSSLTAHFGLQKARRGVIDVLWPGGIRNRYVNAKAGEKIIFPEIPCNPILTQNVTTFKKPRNKKRRFMRCVMKSLRHLVQQKVIHPQKISHFKRGMIDLFRELN